MGGFLGGGESFTLLISLSAGIVFGRKEKEAGDVYRKADASCRGPQTAPQAVFVIGKCQGGRGGGEDVATLFSLVGRNPGSIPHVLTFGVNEKKKKKREGKARTVIARSLKSWLRWPGR